MKISNFLAVGLAVAAVAVSSCDIAKPYEKISGVDKSKAKPAELTLDEDNTSSTGISVYWNGAEAVSAGALAFTCQLVNEYGGAGDNYNTKLSKHMMATDEVGNINDAASFTSLAAGNRYYVRVRADYAYSVCSEWVYLEKNGAVVQISVGNGFVISEFIAPQELKAEALTYSKIKVGWDLIGPAEGYEVSYKAQDKSDWTVADTTSAISNTITISGLTQLTAYDIRVRAFRKVDGVEEWTEYAVLDEAVMTPERAAFAPEIYTADELKEFLEAVAEQAGDEDSYMLMNDIDMSGVTVVPAAEFAGIFDGQNKAIKNLDLNGISLFARNSGTIKNVVIDASCSIQAIPGNFGIIAAVNAGKIENCVNNANIELGDYGVLTYLGAIVGSSTGTVKDCTNNGNITINASTTTGNSFFAGVVGQFSGKEGTVAVSGCKNTGKITYKVSGTPGNPNIAGVVGGTTPHATGKNAALADRKTSAPNVGTVSDCSNTGDITVTWDVNNSGSYTNLGGVVAYIEGSVANCTNEGTVKLATDVNNTAANTRPSVGGVAGYIMYSANGLINKGKVSVSGAYAAGTDGNAGAGSMMQPCFGGVIGGIGYAYLAVQPDESMEGCKNYGELEFKATQKKNGGTKSNTGAVAGYCAAHTIKDCHNYGKALLSSAHYVIYAGGIAGLAYPVEFSSCTNEGEVTFNGRYNELNSAYTDLTKYFSYQAYCGGIVGYICAGCAFKDCENKGEIKFTEFSETAVLSYLGGINGSYSGHCTMENCKNTAAITSTANGSLILGGISGAFNGNITDCSNEADLDCATNGAPSGKETEVGGLIGYANAVAENCSNTGNIKTAVAGSFAGGLFGGWGSGGDKDPYADLIRQVESCSVDCTITGPATQGSLLGHFRSNNAGHYLYYKNMTICSGLASLPVYGSLNGTNYMMEGDAPKKQ